MRTSSMHGLDTFLRDLKQSLRIFRQNPAFTLAQPIRFVPRSAGRPETRLTR